MYVEGQTRKVRVKELVGTGGSARVFGLKADPGKVLKVLKTADVNQVARELVVYQTLPTQGVSPRCWSFSTSPTVTHIVMDRGRGFDCFPAAARAGFIPHVTALYLKWSEMGLYHCDIKPQNFVVLEEPRGRGHHPPQVRVIDWGCCRMQVSFLTAFNHRMCYSRPYRHPAIGQVTAGPVTPSKLETFELWALACTFLVMSQEAEALPVRGTFTEEDVSALAPRMSGAVFEFVDKVISGVITTRAQALTSTLFQTAAELVAEVEMSDICVRKRADSSPYPFEGEGGVQETVLRVAKMLLDIGRGGLMGVVLALLEQNACNHVLVKADTYESAVVYAVLMILDQHHVSRAMVSVIGDNKDYILDAIGPLAMQILCAVPRGAWWPILNHNPFTEFAAGMQFFHDCNKDCVVLAVHAYCHAYIKSHLFRRACTADTIRTSCGQLVEGSLIFWDRLGTSPEEICRIRTLGPTWGLEDIVLEELE